jgi:hypothetical protein
LNTVSPASAFWASVVPVDATNTAAANTKSFISISSVFQEPGAARTPLAGVSPDPGRNLTEPGPERKAPTAGGARRSAEPRCANNARAFLQLSRYIPL